MSRLRARGTHPDSTGAGGSASEVQKSPLGSRRQPKLSPGGGRGQPHLWGAERLTAQPLRGPAHGPGRGAQLAAAERAWLSGRRRAQRSGVSPGTGRSQVGAG